MGSKSNVSAFFRLQFRNGLSTKPAGALLFRMRSPSTFFLGVGQDFAFFLLIFSGFQKQRFGIFQAIVSQWLGHKTCWGSAFSHALPKHLFLGFCLVFSGFQKQRFGIFVAAVSHGLGTISLFLVGSKSNVSAFIGLQFRNGLGAKPAGALLFRMRSPSTFFLGFALFLLIFSGFQKQRFGIFQAAVSQWLGHKTRWGSAFSHALPKHLFLGFCLVFSGFRFGIFWLRFQKQRFGIFPAAVSQWLGHKTCWGSAFSHALPKHLFLGFCLVVIYFYLLFLFIFSGFQKQRFGIGHDIYFYLFLVGSKSNVSALGMISLFFCQRVGIFLAVLSHGLGTISLFLLVGSKSNVSAFFRLQFRNGLGTKLAGALLFSMRSPSTFFWFCLVFAYF